VKTPRKTHTHTKSIMSQTLIRISNYVLLDFLVTKKTVTLEVEPDCLGDAAAKNN